MSSGARKLPHDIVRAPKHDPEDIPEELDWREKGFVTPAWNQGSCGSCYAFSVVSSIMAQHFIKTGSLEELSQQQVIDCSVLTGKIVFINI
jgi:C1A family cysteine protease